MTDLLIGLSPHFIWSLLSQSRWESSEKRESPETTSHSSFDGWRGRQIHLLISVYFHYSDLLSREGGRRGKDKRERERENPLLFSHSLLFVWYAIPVSFPSSSSFSSSLSSHSFVFNPFEFVRQFVGCNGNNGGRDDRCCFEEQRERKRRRKRGWSSHFSTSRLCFCYFSLWKRTFRTWEWNSHQFFSATRWLGWGIGILVSFEYGDGSEIEWDWPFLPFSKWVFLLLLRSFYLVAFSHSHLWIPFLLLLMHIFGREEKEYPLLFSSLPSSYNSLIIYSDYSRLEQLD